jgi:predicted 3-demethylubiquinone-9 3-methyltransferase (glyoxalase superfamily)
MPELQRTRRGRPSTTRRSTAFPRAEAAGRRRTAQGRVTALSPSRTQSQGPRKAASEPRCLAVGGRSFIGLNGGPDFTFTEAISLSIDCDDQAEVDRYWDALLADGGQPSVCGWLKDRFGLSWQVVPRQMNEMFSSPDRAAARRAMEAMLKMVKIDVAEIERAYAGDALPVG